MADQKKWFKVWTSLLVDFDNLSYDDIGRWVCLGCRIALVGDHGKVVFEGGWEHFSSFLKCSVDDTKQFVNRLHGISVEESETVHGGIAVSLKKWYEYQEDSTYKERLKKTRDKRRGEQKRTEQIRTEEKNPPLYSLPKLVFGEHKNVKLTQENYEALIQKYGQETTNSMITDADLYLGSKGNKYKDHYLMLLSWDRKNKKTGSVRLVSPTRQQLSPERKQKYKDLEEAK